VTTKKAAASVRKHVSSAIARKIFACVLLAQALSLWPTFGKNVPCGLVMVRRLACWATGYAVHTQLFSIGKEMSNSVNAVRAVGTKSPRDGAWRPGLIISAGYADKENITS